MKRNQVTRVESAFYACLLISINSTLCLRGTARMVSFSVVNVYVRGSLVERDFITAHYKPFEIASQFSQTAINKSYYIRANFRMIPLIYYETLSFVKFMGHLFSLCLLWFARNGDYIINWR